MYAGFWKRFLACLIDTVIVTVAMFVLGFALGFFFAWLGLLQDEQSEFFIGMVLNLLGLILGVLYFVVMESSSRQATFGKALLGIKVTTTDGEQLTFWRAVGRYFGKILSGLIFCIGYLMVAFTEKKQGLHDLMSGCVVVNKNAA